MKRYRRQASLSLFLSTLLLAGCVEQEKYKAYLFAYFTGTGPGEEAVRFSVSEDGYHYRALNNNQPVLNNEAISTTGGVRDPHIIYYAYANEDFTTLESVPEQLLHNPTHDACIDGDIVKKDGRDHEISPENE